MELYRARGRALGPPPPRGSRGTEGPHTAAGVAAVAAAARAARGGAAAQPARALPLVQTAAALAAESAAKGALKATGEGPDLDARIHTLVTSNGSPYLNVQTRIMHATYKKVAAGPGGGAMAGFTRILHRSAPDELVAEVPTHRVAPATPACDGWCEFPVADRPPAVRAFFDAVRAGGARLDGGWVFLAETDYVFIAPLTPPGPSTTHPGTLFPFGYIDPGHPDAAPHVARLLPAGVPPSSVPGTGPAPALLPVAAWDAVVPHWVAATAAVEADADGRRVLGWVREMYAFSAAVAAATAAGAMAPPALPAPPLSPLIAQPPADADAGAAAALHYTWGANITDRGGAPVWAFDKRAWTDAALVSSPPTLAPVPEWEEGWRLAGGERVSAELAATLAREAAAINAAVASLPKLGERQ